MTNTPDSTQPINPDDKRFQQNPILDPLGQYKISALPPEDIAQQPTSEIGPSPDTSEYFRQYQERVTKYFPVFTDLVGNDPEKARQAYLTISADLFTRDQIKWRPEDFQTILSRVQEKDEYMHLLGDKWYAKTAYAIDEIIRQAPETKEKIFEWLTAVDDHVSSTLKKITGISFKSDH